MRWLLRRSSACLANVLELNQQRLDAVITAYGKAPQLRTRALLRRPNRSARRCGSTSGSAISITRTQHDESTHGPELLTGTLPPQRQTGRQKTNNYQWRHEDVFQFRERSLAIMIRGRAINSASLRVTTSRHRQGEKTCGNCFLPHRTRGMRACTERLPLMDGTLFARGVESTYDSRRQATADRAAP